MNTEGRQGNVKALMGNCDVITEKGQEERGAKEGIQYYQISILRLRRAGMLSTKVKPGRDSHRYSSLRLCDFIWLALQPVHISTHETKHLHKQCLFLP